MKPTHTPTPYHVERPFGETGVYIAANTTALVCKLYPVDGRIVAAGQETTEATAEFICRAANCHDELLAALEATYNVITNILTDSQLDQRIPCGRTIRDWASLVAAAIKKAKA